MQQRTINAGEKQQWIFGKPSCQDKPVSMDVTMIPSGSVEHLVAHRNLDWFGSVSRNPRHISQYFDSTMDWWEALSHHLGAICFDTILLESVYSQVSLFCPLCK